MTEDHRFWSVTDDDWVELQDLDTSDVLLTPDGATVTVDWLDWDAGVTTDAYDLTVDQEHNFFVTADTTGQPVLVHNQNTAGFFCGVPVDADLVPQLLAVDSRLTDVERLRFASAVDRLNVDEAEALIRVIASEGTDVGGARIARNSGVNPLATQAAIQGDIDGAAGFAEGLLGGVNFDRFATVFPTTGARADAADIVRRLADDLNDRFITDEAFGIARAFTDNPRSQQALIRYASDTSDVVDPLSVEQWWGSADAVLDTMARLLDEGDDELLELFVDQMGQIRRGQLDELVQALDEDPIEFLELVDLEDAAGRPLWLQIVELGRRFNADNNARYVNQGGAAELYLRASDNNGPPYFILDAYIPPRPGVEGQIVSRKNTQLASVQEATAIGYIGELGRKYKAGSTIASTNSVPTNLRGGTLQGQQYLEVPVQNQPIPQAVLDAATDADVLIRDVAGRIYN